MKAAVQYTLGDADVLEFVEVDEPSAGPGELLVRVAAASVNPVDVYVRSGAYPMLGEPPFTLGWDVAGQVEAIGAGVEGFSVGDRVFALSRFGQQAATYAELAVVSAVDAARTPEGWDDREAAGLPLVGLTAWQGLQAAGIGPGRRVLIQGAGGGVGHVAVQIAKALGAYVIATASPAKLEAVSGLGADEVIDYTVNDLSTIELVDIVLDPFGGEATSAVLPLVRDGGSVVSLQPAAPEAIERLESTGRHHVQHFVSSSGEQLGQLAQLVADGKLRVIVADTFSLADVAAAHRAVETGSTLGKVIVTP